MKFIPSSALQRIRASGSRFFHRFGIHCATHQIRVILISAVVITSLLFPAIAIYSSSQTHFFAFTLRVLDSFITPNDISNYFAHNDLRHLWEGYDTLRVREDSVTRARCGMEGILRSERVLVHSISQNDTPSTLSYHTLLSTLKLEERISDLLSARGLSCLSTSSGRCFTLSPLAFWNHDPTALQADTNILDTLSLSKNISISGVPITPEMVLAGRESGDHPNNDGTLAMFLVLTFLFPDTDCMGNAGHFKWLHVLEEAAAFSGDLLMQAQAPRLIALEHDKSPRSRLSILSVFSYFAYLTFAIYFTSSMRRMDTVHSRVGLAFTGLVEIVASTMTSLSVCALVGFRVTMVPWQIFPIVVIFIGVENMFSLVDAVIKTSIALPVKERIAEGLSKAGTSNTLKLFSYNFVLGVIAFFSTGAIRQFCAFAIVVLVAHWFLVHTFFVTVLSIDIQRLELDELLRQGASLAPSVPGGVDSTTMKQPRTKGERFVGAIQNLLRGRAAKNISLVLLLAITATLYYATYPHPTRNKDDTRVMLSRSGLVRTPKVTKTDGISPASHIWRILNPTNDDLVHIRIESPAVLVIDPDAGEDGSTASLRQPIAEYDKTHRLHSSRLSQLLTRTLRHIAWLLKIVIVPMTFTIVVLYGLLLYLLKDAELLEAQRNRPESDSPDVEEIVPSVEGHISFTTLPRAFATDVELIAASKDGNVVATVGIQNEFVLWRMETQTYTAVDTSDVLFGSSASTPSAAATLTSVAVNDKGSFCAVGTGAGLIAVWFIGKDHVQSLPHLSADSTFSAVTQIQFGLNSAAGSGRSTPRRSSSASSVTGDSNLPESPGCLYATYENGAIIKWEFGSFATYSYLTPSRAASVQQSMLLPVQADERLLVGFSLEDGTLELSDVGQPDGTVGDNYSIAAGNPSDLVTKVHVCRVQLGGESHLVVGAATQAGIISLWDGHTGECIYILDEAYGDITNLRITPVPTKTCPACGQVPLENFSLSFSIGQVVLFYRAYLSAPTRHCSCEHNRPKPMMRSSLGLRSRSSSCASVASSGTLTPVHSRSRLSSISSITSTVNASMFPVSAHGVHSRRASEKESQRRNLESTFLFPDDDCESHLPVGPQDVTPASPANLLSPNLGTSMWRSLVVIRAADATFERGSWDVADNKIVGIRRKPRMPFVKGKAPRVEVRAESSRGLTPAALDRWELWTFDPSDSRLLASPLAVLENEDAHLMEQKNKVRVGSGNSARRRGGAEMAPPRLPFTRVSPFLGSRSFCLAGFGNTVGLFNFNANAQRHST